jgi:hypothetical protein
MLRATALVTALLALLGAACAQSPTHRTVSSISFEVEADPANHLARLTCKNASSGECVVWVGDAGSPGHKSLHIAAGASLELVDDGKGKDICAKPFESDLSWPGCVKSPSGGAIDRSRSIDLYFR